MKYWIKYIFIGVILSAFSLFYATSADYAEHNLEFIGEYPKPIPPQDIVQETDTGKTLFPVAPVVPDEYKDLISTYPLDLETPRNLNSEFQYNPLTNRYELRTKVGDIDIVTPLTLTQDEYLDYSLKKSMNSFFREKYAEELAETEEGKKDILSMFDFQFDLGPAEKLFGPGGVKLNASGSAQVKMGAIHTKNGNPTLSERQKNRTAFDFDTQVQARIDASVGDKINFNLNYDTESTFDFDREKLKLAYVGKEDEIIKVLEFGNVSMNTTNSLIRGGTALFGAKTELQFGKLTVGAVISQQESQARTASSRGSSQTEAFEITADEYDNNMHFFLGHYFYDKYDDAMKTLPYPSGGISIERIEVWITNKRANFDQARNIVAFIDLGENGENIYNPNLVSSTGQTTLPNNRINSLYEHLISSAEGARDINQVNQTLSGLGFENAADYEKIENARLLTTSEYTLNAQLGYISLRSALQSDEVLAVAFSYTHGGQVYQVGEFSNDNLNNTKQNLYVKLLKGTNTSPDYKTWRLMMKNIYTIGRHGSAIHQDMFRLDVKYQNDTTGVYMNYLTEGAIANKSLLSVMNLDNLDSRNEPYPDGFFDFVEGMTTISQRGQIIFPVTEPFGKHLKKKINDDAIAEKYIFTELYDSTLTIARQTAEKNKFILQGEYKGSSTSEISLGGSNIAAGSVTVTANGVRLTENVDYIVDQASGRVTIINPIYENASIDVTSESRDNFSMQRKTMMGMNLNYAFNPNFNIGATIMNLSEMPTTMKTAPGMESVNNTLWGLNINYATQSQALTNLLDKLPLLELTAPSQITFNAEFAHLIAGHYKSKYGGDHSYIDDFESAERSIDLRSPYSWSLSSTPSLFSESKLVNDIEYGNNRALLAWYYIDGLFTRSSSLTPTHIKNDKEQLSNHYVREILETELFPDKDIQFNQSSTIPVLNLAYYPKERGPYNLDGDNVEFVNGEIRLRNPERRWGGITRRIESGNTDFEAQNIETIEFWLLDPFIYEDNGGGDLYINLGEISEDVLKDERKFFENGLPIDGDTTKVEKTVWGHVPLQQSLTYAFDNTEGARRAQDVGLNGLSSQQEQNFPTYMEYLARLQRNLGIDDLTARQMRENDPFSPFSDPAGDIYHYFRGSDYDRMEMPILGRYKRYNGTEGNSVANEDSPESYSTAAKLTPDVEDINQDNTLNETEKYFQYKVSIRKQDLEVGKNYIVQKKTVKPALKIDSDQTVDWYQFKIPLSEFQDQVGGIKDFKTIRFMRMFMTNFTDSVVLRFGTFKLVRGDWRVYTKDPDKSGSIVGGNTSLVISTVNLEESGSKEPVNYIMPPGVNRILDPGQTQLRQQNEQSLSLKIQNLDPGDARAIYLSTRQDMRQYRRMQMFTHAEKLLDDARDLEDHDLSVFLRLGSDYTNNYYEYEIPLKLTPHKSNYNQSSLADREAVWPEINMFDFPFELLTNLKLERNRERRKTGSEVTYYTPYSNFDPNKPLNKVTVVGNPTISDVKVIMIGVRNNSRDTKSAELWVNELRLTEFNEDGGWAANANLFVGLSDLGSFSFAGRKETAGFGGLDQGIMDRNLDDTHNINFAAQVQLGKFFPEKVNVNLPVNFSYREEVVSPKYNPLDQDILLKDALDNVETKAEKDSITGFAVDKITQRTLDITNVRVDVQSKTPMPYDPANFTFGYSNSESNIQNATTEYERETKTRLSLSYNYSPRFKPWQPFNRPAKPKEGEENSNSVTNKGNNRQSSSAGNRFLKEFSINYLPGNISFNSDISREYLERQLRDLSSISAGNDNMIPVSFREDFYWNRDASIRWDLTKNLKMDFRTNTNARIETPHVQVNKELNYDEYSLWKDSVMRSLRNWGTPMEYAQTFNASYTIPFSLIPALNFLNAGINFNSTYNWDKGAEVNSEDYIDLGNTIRNTRTIGANNVSVNLLNLYNKSDFLKKANDKYVLKQQLNSERVAQGRATRRNIEQTQREKAKQEKRNKKFEGQIQLSPDSAIRITHNLDNKRVRITARNEAGKIYELKHKAIDNNTIQIKNKDTVNLNIVINQLKPQEELGWYKVAQGASRFLMMVRNVTFSYNETSGMMLPNFAPNIGNFTGQGNTPMGNAPGFDFAFGLTGESYVQKALDNGWLIKNSEYSINPAIFNKQSTFSLKADLEPIVGLKVTLNAVRTKSDQSQVYFMYEDMQSKLSGNFTMTTIGLKSIFEMSDASDGYNSKIFNKFLDNRSIIAGRLENAYSRVRYPNEGFIASETGYGGQQYNPELGGVELNSPDVLIPAFLAAYTGKNPRKIGLTAFPSLKNILPNWHATYSGLIQIPFIQKHFKAFTLDHKYEATYSVGAFNSFLTWVPADADGIGFVRNAATGNPTPSSPYDILAVSIRELFRPFIGVNSTFHNNASLKLQYNLSNTVNLNLSSFQIIETSDKEFVLGVGYRFENFNRVLKIRSTGGNSFNNELKVQADVSYTRSQNIIRKIEDGFSQAQTGDSRTMLKMTADYNLSRMITLQAFFDKQISNPLISSSAYPVSTTSLGISCKINLGR